MLQDIQCNSDIKQLIDSFYLGVLRDESIGYIFTEVVKIQMDIHMPIMYSFWESILFGTGDYKGNPMTKHIQLNKKTILKAEHFERWLSLWTENIDKQFVGPTAEEAKKRATQIAQVMQLKINQ